LSMLLSMHFFIMLASRMMGQAWGVNDLRTRAKQPQLAPTSCFQGGHLGRRP
jgi:hypothetical protein